MSRVKLVLDQIVFARTYSERLLGSLPESDWFRMPPGGVTHVAWQVGHLTMAQYRLALERIRGAKPEDAALISEAFLRAFGRESVPDPDPGKHPPLPEIRATLNRVHQQVPEELPGLPEADLDSPILKPHALAKTKFEALVWCAHHEMVHAGQIGLERRHLGYPPLW